MVLAARRWACPLLRPATKVTRSQARADAVAAGHVHLQWLRRFGDVLWFCVGSVGLVYEQKQPPDPVPFLPWSEYAIVDDELEVSFRRIEDALNSHWVTHY